MNPSDRNNLATPRLLTNVEPPHGVLHGSIDALRNLITRVGLGWPIQMSKKIPAPALGRAARASTVPVNSREFRRSRRRDVSEVLGAKARTANSVFGSFFWIVDYYEGHLRY